MRTPSGSIKARSSDSVSHSSCRKADSLASRRMVWLLTSPDPMRPIWLAVRVMGLFWSVVAAEPRARVLPRSTAVRHDRGIHRSAPSSAEARRNSGWGRACRPSANQ